MHVDGASGPSPDRPLHDPLEGIASDWTIVTGASHDRIPARFRPVLDAAVSHFGSAAGHPSLYVYGSVATGTAVVPDSDVDLLTVGLPAPEASELAITLTERFRRLCRGVEVGVAHPRDFVGDSNQAYGARVFVKHYCVSLHGPDISVGYPRFPADVHAARGFNGDIAQLARRWRDALQAGSDPGELGRRIARKSLLAVAGLVSVHDRTWTTDRRMAAERWAVIEPSLADGLRTLLRWSNARGLPDQSGVIRALDGTVAVIIGQFASTIGLWD